MVVWAGGEYQYPLGESAAGTVANRRLRVGGDVSRREYQGSAFDRMTVAGHVGPRWLIGRRSEASVLLSALHHRAGSGTEAFAYHDVGLRVEGRHRFTGRTTVHGRLSRRERRHDDHADRDGPITDVSVDTGWLASQTLRFDALLGWTHEQTERERWRNTRRWAQLGATAALPWGFTVGGSGTVHWSDFEGNWAPWVLGGGSRSDGTRSLRLDVHNRAFTVGGFSPRVSVVREERDSNAQLHDYERTFGEHSFVRLF